ncbi:MAG TPA: NFACT RNA binding domain-containing protein [Gemmatimonadaceae bacterium]|nr:NFACT RNA binding domain-containing protein [Gemmatimonadaceae bacterium]
MDSLTAHYLARELDDRWKGQLLRGVLVDQAARLVVVHPAAGEAVAIDLASPDVPVRQYTGSAVGALLQRWVVRNVLAPEDDRRLIIALSHEGRFRGSASRRATLEVSAISSARAAVLRESGGRITAAIGRQLPPHATPRPVLDRATLESAVAALDMQALLSGRWLSARLARWLMHEPGRAWERYAFICSLPEPRPTWCDDQLLPFPMCENGRPAESLIVRDGSPAERGAAHAGADRSDRSDRSDRGDGTDRADRARRRMRAELERATAAPLYRAAADVLLALGSAPAPGHVMIGKGSRVDVAPRRGETGLEAANRLYATARSMERALAQLPERLAAMSQPNVDTGTAAPPAPASTGRPLRSSRPGPNAFRTYRSSGGLDIWVGRGAASNDELTFHAAAPEDVWLHARDNAGAHVVLRWQHHDAPPERDLGEAAMLAAWHSKSRGSAVVPVDWTRRKYVRKPRGAAPGLVVVQRCRTVFARPDAQLERALRRDMRVSRDC